MFFLIKIDKLILNYTWKCKRSRTKAILKNKKAKGPTLLEIKNIKFHN